MALRVLLADESSTIKKVMQLALQDYGIEVKAVANGLDVIPVATSFKPDIIFVDVLLAKKTGYEVCLEIKSHSELSTIPVIIMWSGFMELDQAKVKEAKPDARLEKPFDAETLRGLVENFVIKPEPNPISQYLKFPNLPDFEESPAAAPAAVLDPVISQIQNLPQVPVAREIPTAPIQSTPIEEPTLTTPKSAFDIPSYQPHEFDMDSEVDEPEEFSQVPLPSVRNQEYASDLSKFKIQINDDTGNIHKNFEEQFFSVSEEDDESQFVIVDDLEDLTPQKNKPVTKSETAPQSASQAISQAIPQAAPLPPPPTPMNTVAVDPEMVEMMVREQVRSVIESIAWKLLPELTEKIIREELNKLLKESEQKFQARP